MATPRLRVLSAGEGLQQFPTWWPKSAVEPAFTMVSQRPDLVMLPLPRGNWAEEDFQRNAALAELAPGRPVVAYYPFDSWDDPARGWFGRQDWNEMARRYFQRADIVAGPQLPAHGGPRCSVPLPYPPQVRRVTQPPDLGRTSCDVHFAGAFRPPAWAAPLEDTRDRRYRGYLVALLESALPPERLLVRKVLYWQDSPQDRAALRRRYREELDRSLIVLAPAGYGYLTFRHADAWARGRVVLSEGVHRHVRVPEPERWEAGETCLEYHPAEDDILDVVKCALDDPGRLRSVAAAGWDYGRKWTDPYAQVALLAGAVGAFWP